MSQTECLEKLIHRSETREVYLHSRHIIDILSEFVCQPLSVEEVCTNWRVLSIKLIAGSEMYAASSATVVLHLLLFPANSDILVNHSCRGQVSSTWIGSCWRGIDISDRAYSDWSACSNLHFLQSRFPPAERIDHTASYDRSRNWLGAIPFIYS